jgi:hypothetical protein
VHWWYSCSTKCSCQDNGASSNAGKKKCLCKIK